VLASAKNVLAGLRNIARLVPELAPLCAPALDEAPET
jgi:hypothetical protein